MGDPMRNSVTTKTLIMAGSLALSGTMLVALPSAAAPATTTTTTVATQPAATNAMNAKSPQSFAACQDESGISTLAVAADDDLGAQLGPGITELLNADLVASVSEGLGTSLPPETHAMRYLDNGAIHALDSAGASLVQVSEASGDLTLPDKGTEIPESPDAILHPEVKRIIGACLGFGGAGGMSFEALVRYLGEPKNAAKFVIRRIGIAGAVSCVGGVIWEYI